MLARPAAVPLAPVGRACGRHPFPHPAPWQCQVGLKLLTRLGLFVLRGALGTAPPPTAERPVAYQRLIGSQSKRHNCWQGVCASLHVPGPPTSAGRLAALPCSPARICCGSFPSYRPHIPRMVVLWLGRRIPFRKLDSSIRFGYCAYAGAPSCASRSKLAISDRWALPRRTAL